MNSAERPGWLVLLGLPFGLVSGLLGLSGTVDRAPVVRALAHCSGERAAPLNLAISFMALGGAMVGRSSSVGATLCRPFLPELLALAAGMFAGLHVAGRCADKTWLARVARQMPSVLVVIGALLICATTLPHRPDGLPFGPSLRVPAGLGLGLLLGAVSRARDISGGELMLPALVLAFGIDVKIAGTVVALASLPAVLAGVVRATREDRYVREREFRDIVRPIGGGAALGAVIGGRVLAFAPSSLLAILTGAALIASAVRSFREGAREPAGVTSSAPAPPPEWHCP